MAFSVKKMKIAPMLVNLVPWHEDVWGSRGIAPSFLISRVDGDEGSVPRPESVTSGKRSICTHFIGDWMGPRTGLDPMEKRKCLTSTGNRTL
jgi:hypothetical protein